MCDPSIKNVADIQTTNSSSGGLNPGESSSTEHREAEEGDMSRKDQVKIAFIPFIFQIRLIKRHTFYFTFSFILIKNI